MKWLAAMMLVGPTAHADGVAVTAHIGPSHLDPCAGCEDTRQPAWGAAGGIEAGYAFRFAETSGAGHPRSPRHAGRRLRAPRVARASDH